MDTDVAVVGAGLTGLALCHELESRGVECTLLERADRPGGLVRSVEREGRVLDLGPQRTRLTSGVAELVEELGLGNRLVRARRGLPLFVYREGSLREVPRDLATLWKTDLLSSRSKLRLLLEPLSGSAGSDESVAELFTRKFGREAYLHLFGPLYGGIYGSDPRRMPVRYSLRHALEAHGMSGSIVIGWLRRRLRGHRAPPAVTFDAGMEVLPAALHRRHGSRVRPGVRVREVVPAADGLRVRTDRGEMGARSVVLTVPADAAAGMLRSAAPGTAAGLARLTYNPLAVVHLLSRLEIHGYGFQLSLAERGCRTRGVTFNASLFGRDGVFTSYLGGSSHPGVVEASDRELGEIAREEFRRLTGGQARPLHVYRVRMPAFDESWESLDAARRAGDLPAGIHLCASYQIRPGIPGRLQRARILADRLAAERDAHEGEPAASTASAGASESP